MSFPAHWEEFCINFIPVCLFGSPLRNPAKGLVSYDFIFRFTSKLLFRRVFGARGWILTLFLVLSESEQTLERSQEVMGEPGYAA